MELICETGITEACERLLMPVRLVVEGEQRVRLAPAQAGNEATHALVNMLGRPFLVHPPERDRAVSSEIAARGCWEATESQVLLTLARPAMTVLDVGANIGYYTVLLGDVLGRGGTIFAFEPEPANYWTLVANALLARRVRGSRVNVQALQLALSDRRGSAELSVVAGNLGLHSLRLTTPNARRIRVATGTIDALRWGAGDTAAAIARPIDLIKADTQAGEKELLAGAARTLTEDRPIVCLEFEPHPCPEAVCLDVLGRLTGHGYTRFRLFHSNRERPVDVLAELGRVLNAEQVAEEVRQKRVGTYGTLLAVHEGC